MLDALFLQIEMITGILTNILDYLMMRNFIMIIPKEISFRQKLYDHIKLREGYKNVVYLDTLGKPTGGIGHLLLPEEKKLYPVGCPC